MKTLLQNCLSTATRLAQEATRVVMELRTGPISKTRKEDRSWVTEADLRSDKIIREGLAQAFPDHSILTEESGLSGKTGSDWIWVVDPLDGTKAYAKGIHGFSVMVGLLKEGQPHLGVVVDPIEGLLYEAIRGHGAWLTSLGKEGGKKTRLKVSDRNKPSEMRLVTSRDVPQEMIEKIRSVLNGPLCAPINSVGIKVGLIVRQEADIYVNPHSVHYWDTCAPQILLEEAGGRFTRLDGKPLTYAMDGKPSHDALTLATNGTLHSEIAGLLSGIVSTP